jgi:predicted transcriptional regulator
MESVIIQNLNNRGTIYMLLSKKVMNFIIHIKNNDGKVTKKTQYLHPIQYYTMCWHLRDSKIIKENGSTKDGQKIWTLTEKGKNLSELLEQVKRVINDE